MRSAGSWLRAPKVDKICTALRAMPGSRRLQNALTVGAEDIDRNMRFCNRENDIDLAVIGPEVPLAMGIVDELESCRSENFRP